MSTGSLAEHQTGGSSDRRRGVNYGIRSFTCRGPLHESRWWKWPTAPTANLFTQELVGELMETFAPASRQWRRPCRHRARLRLGVLRRRDAEGTHRLLSRAACASTTFPGVPGIPRLRGARIAAMHGPRSGRAAWARWGFSPDIVILAARIALQPEFMKYGLYSRDGVHPGGASKAGAFARDRDVFQRPRISRRRVAPARRSVSCGQAR